MTKRAACLALVLTTWSITSPAVRYENPRFSADEQKIAFDYCDPKCRFVVYDIRTKASISFAPVDDEEYWITPSFSPSSLEVVFVLARRAGESQIAKIGTNGTGFTILTKSRTVKRSPSFAPSGKDIIYSVRERQHGVRGDWFGSDAYVVNLVDGLERRLTDLRVMQLHAPQFTSDGKYFTFATVGAARPRSNAPEKLDLERLYPERTSFIAPFNAPQDFRPLVDPPETALAPQPIRGGEIAVLGRVNEIDKLGGGYAYDVFLAGEGDKRGLRRLTRLRTLMRSYGVSPSGRFVVFVVGQEKARGEIDRLMLWKQGEELPSELPVGPAKILRAR